MVKNLHAVLGTMKVEHLVGCSLSKMVVYDLPTVY